MLDRGYEPTEEEKRIYRLGTRLWMTNPRIIAWYADLQSQSRTGGEPIVRAPNHAGDAITIADLMSWAVYSGHAQDADHIHTIPWRTDDFQDASFLGEFLNKLQYTCGVPEERINQFSDSVHSNMSFDDFFNNLFNTFTVQEMSCFGVHG